jgi:SAM-dependent methyltransferase
MKKNSIVLLVAFTVVMHCYSMDIRNPSLYQGLCTEFWDLDKPSPTADVYAFFRHYVAKASGPILEPMCGTGRYLIPFVEEGFNVEGFDASPFMYNELRKKCAQKKISPRIWEQFLEVVPEAKKYNLIFLPDTSFSIFLNVPDIKKALRKIYSLLLPGGIFVFDIQTIYSQPDNIGIWIGKAHRNAEGNTIIESTLPLPTKNSISPIILRYELMDKFTIQKTETEYYQTRLYQPTEMDDYLKEVGFKHVKRIKAYDHTRTPAAKDFTIVYECTK